MSGRKVPAAPRERGRPAATATAAGASADEALRFLHEARRTSREERRKSVWLVVYTIALVGSCWGIPVFISWTKPSPGEGPAVAIPQQMTGMPLFLLPALLLLVLLLAARGAMWRGPVVLDQAATHLLLPSKVGRRTLLLPELRGSAALAAVVGAVAGGVTGFLLQDLTARPWAAPTAAGALCGLSVAGLSSALGALVERHAESMAGRARTVFAIGWCLTAVAAAGAVVAWRGHETFGLEQALLWSGPWGWAAQPVLWALGLMGPQAVAGALLAVCAAALGLVLAVRELPGIPLSALRLRATVAAQVSASVAMLDFRQARSGVPVLKARRSTPWVRLPMPRQKALLVPWRDLSCLLRNPRRLGWALVWTGLALVAMAAASSLEGTPQQIGVGVALVAFYLGAAQLTEPARLESDDARRSTNLPWSFRGLALLHALVPLALLLVGACAGVTACVLAGVPAKTVLPLLAAVPSVVAAALVSSYRGVMPMHLAIGVNTPMGNTGPWQAACWYVRGPLVAVCLLFPVCLAAARGGAYGTPQVVWQLVVAAACMWWARYTAHRVHTK